MKTATKKLTVREIRDAAYHADPEHNPVSHAAIQIGDYVEVLGLDRDNEGLPVCGTVSSYSRIGNLYDVSIADGTTRRVTGSRLRKSR